MKIFKKALSAATAAAMSASMLAVNIGSLGTVNAAGSQSAIDLVNDMGQGWNLGNTFDCWGVKAWASQTETGWGNPVTSKSVIDSIKASGFDSVRIPVTWYENTDSSTFDISDAYLERVKAVVDYCIANDMYAVINMHWDWESGGSLWLNKGLEAKTQFTTMWKEIANYFKDYDNHLVFEAMNEVTFDYAALNEMNAAFVDTVRATGGGNADRLLVLAGANADLTKTLNSSYTVPDDDMLAVSIHYYTPPAFCVAQPGTSWGYSDTWGSASEVNAVYNDFEKMKSYYVDKGIPVLLDEYGVLTNGNKNEESIEKFLETVATAGANTDGIATYLWDSGNCGDMQFFDRKTLTWNNSDVEAMYKKLGNGGGTVNIGWVDTDYNAVTDEKTGSVVDGAYQISIGSATKVKFAFTGVNSAGGTGGVSYWDNAANNGKGAWVQNGVNFRFAIDKDGNAEIAQTEENSDGDTIDVNYNFIELPEGVSTDNVQVQIFYAGYADSTGAWKTLSAADYPKMTLAQIPGVVTDPQPVVTTTAEQKPAETTTTTAKPAPETTTTADPGEETPTYTGVYANAFLAGSIGDNQFWNAEEAEASGTVAEVDGNGSYEVSLNVASETIEFLILSIQGIEEFDGSFTTDTFKDLSVKVDEISIDGTPVEFTDDSAAYNLKYYENAGSTRVYLTDTWNVNKGKSLGIEGPVTSEIKVKFTVAGTYQESSSTPSKTVYGDANEDGFITVADATCILQAIGNADRYGLSEQGRLNADVDGSAGISGIDALVVQLVELGIYQQSELPLKAGSDIKIN